MTLDDVLKILKAHAPNNQLALGPDAFGASAPVSKLLTAEVPGTHLKTTVTKLELDSANNRVLLTGTGTAAPVTKMGVTAYFTLDDTAVEMQLTATAVAGWTYADSFPQLAGSFAEHLAFSDATLLLDSHDLPAFSAAVLPGASIGPQVFNGKLGFAEDIAWLLGNKADLTISGAVTLQDGMPAFDFKVDVGKISIPPLGDLEGSFSFSGAVNKREIEPIGGGAKTTEYDTALDLGLRVEIQIGSVDVALFVDLSTAGLLQVTAAFAAGKQIALSDLSGVSGGADLSTALPKGGSYDPGSSFALGALSMTISPTKQQVSSVSVMLEGAPNWPLFKGTTISGVGIGLQVMDPKGQKLVQGQVFGDISWPGGTLRATGTYTRSVEGKSTLTIEVGLTEGSTIHVTTVLNMLLNASVPGDLDIDELDLIFTPSSGDISLTTDVKGDWPINLGIVTVKLEQAGLEIARAGGQTTGQIYARAAIGPAELSGVWTLPKDFKLSGTLTKAETLNDIIKAVTDIDPPAGMPVIDITGASATISVSQTPAFFATRLSAAQTVYDFSAQASASVEKGGKTVPLGTAFFEVRKGQQGFGFLAGFKLPDNWSPADLVPELRGVFSLLVFNQTGMLISSIEAKDIQIAGLNLPALPQSVDPSIVVFTSLKLEGALTPIGKIFSSPVECPVEFDLLAVLDLRTPLSSTITASLRTLHTNNTLQINDVKLVIAPGDLRLVLTIDAQIKVGDEQLAISGSATAQLKQGLDIHIDLVITEWKNPFGIHGLIVKTFGLSIGLSDGQPTIGVIGSFEIGETDPFLFTLALQVDDFEVPGAIAFKLDSASGRILMLSDLIEQFVPDLDVSHVPVLDAVGFARIDFLLVDDPNGFRIGEVYFPPGIRLDADIVIYDWEGKFDIAVNQSKGIYAKGSISKPIDLGDGLLVISDTEGTKGPDVLIDTSAFISGLAMTGRQGFRLGQIDLATGGHLIAYGDSRLPVRVTAGAATYLELDASVSLLKVYKQAIKIAVSTDRFDFLYEFEFLGIKEQLSCNFSQAQKSFAATADFSFDFKLDTNPLKINGVTVVPALKFDGPAASLDLGIGLTWSGTPDGSLSAHIAFAWRGYAFDFKAELTLADIENALDKAWQAITAWIASNLRQFLEPLIKDIETFVDAIKNGVLEFAHDAIVIGAAIYNLFVDTVSDLAKEIALGLKTLAFSFAEIVQAIAQLFNLSVQEASKIVSAIWGQCSMAGADALLYAPMARQVHVQSRVHALPPRLLIDLQATQQGQQFLLHYYEHQAELVALLTARPEIAARVESATRAFDRSAMTGAPLAPALLDVVDAIMPLASDRLRESLIAFRPTVRAMGTAGAAEVAGRYAWTP